MTSERLWDVDVAWDAAGLKYDDRRPVRMPHHSVSLAGMIGGGRPLMPGEVTLANHGVLYLENLQEFSPNALDRVSVAHRDGQVTITSRRGTHTMPSDFLLFASAWPCACGNFGSPKFDCTCSFERILGYQNAITKHLQFDMQVGIAPTAMDGDGYPMTSYQMKCLVYDAQRFAEEHEGDFWGTADADAATYVRDKLDAREDVARIARTIANVEQSETVTLAHVAEAAKYCIR